MNRLGYFVLSLLIISACSSQRNLYDVVDYGAKGDSLTINTSAIQQAIDVCHKNGGGTVLIANGIFISGTIILKDNVHLEIDKSAKLLGSPNKLDYQSIDTFVDATGQERGNCLIGAKGAKNIKISGGGIIDGNGESFLKKNLQLTANKLNINTEKHQSFFSNRPFLLRFVNASHIKLHDIHLRQSAAWACHFYQSNDIEVESITIYNHAHANNDGIDLDSSYDVRISNTLIDSGDDALCIKSTSPLPTYNINIRNCKLKSDWGALKLGTESMGDFHHINIKDCEVYETRGGGIKILSVDGANIHDVFMENITMNTVDMPIFIRLGERLRTYRDAKKQAVGSIKNVHLKNIKATTQELENSRISAPSGIFITGTPNHKIESIHLENIQISLSGSKMDHVSGSVEELETAYPEYVKFGILPAYGLYARHVDSLHVANIEFKTPADKRADLLLDDVSYQTIASK